MLSTDSVCIAVDVLSTWLCQDWLEKLRQNHDARKFLLQEIQQNLLSEGVHIILEDSTVFIKHKVGTA